MDTRNLIEASATVVTITTLRPGDVYKRVVPALYSTTEQALRYGIVTSVMNNGEDSAFAALEFTASFNSVTVESKVFAAGSLIALFAATPEEVHAHVNDLRKEADRKVESTQRAYEDAMALRQVVQESTEKALAGTLTAPQVTVGAIQGELAV